MVTREGLEDWIVEALNRYKGRASIVQVCKYVWRAHEKELRDSGDLFFTWQYDIRWAATRLRKKGVLKPSDLTAGRAWELR